MLGMPPGFEKQDARSKEHRSFRNPRQSLRLSMKTKGGKLPSPNKFFEEFGHPKPLKESENLPTLPKPHISPLSKPAEKPSEVQVPAPQKMKPFPAKPVDRFRSPSPLGHTSLPLMYGVNTDRPPAKDSAARKAVPKMFSMKGSSQKHEGFFEAHLEEIKRPRHPQPCHTLNGIDLRPQGGDVLQANIDSLPASAVAEPNQPQKPPRGHSVPPTPPSIHKPQTSSRTTKGSLEKSDRDDDAGGLCLESLFSSCVPQKTPAKTAETSRKPWQQKAESKRFSMMGLSEEHEGFFEAHLEEIKPPRHPQPCHTLNGIDLRPQGEDVLQANIDSLPASAVAEPNQPQKPPKGHSVIMGNPPTPPSILKPQTSSLTTKGSLEKSDGDDDAGGLCLQSLFSSCVPQKTPVITAETSRKPRQPKAVQTKDESRHPQCFHKDKAMQLVSLGHDTFLIKALSPDQQAPSEFGDIDRSQGGIKRKHVSKSAPRNAAQTKRSYSPTRFSSPNLNQESRIEIQKDYREVNKRLEDLKTHLKTYSKTTKTLESVFSGIKIKGRPEEKQQKYEKLTGFLEILSHWRRVINSQVKKESYFAHYPDFQVEKDFIFPIIGGILHEASSSKKSDDFSIVDITIEEDVLRTTTSTYIKQNEYELKR